MILKRRKPPKMGLRKAPQVRCPAHLQFVRGFECAIKGKKGLWREHEELEHVCQGTVQAAHVRSGTDGGAGVKPSDRWAIPLCLGAHAQQHAVGEPAFEAMWGIDMKKIAAGLASRSPHLRKLK